MARLTEQYLEYVELMRRRNLELAAEYLLMAALLMEIKSRMLLPRHRNIENVYVRLADEIEQQVERAFEGIEEDLERVRRNVQVRRQLEHGLAAHRGNARVRRRGRRQRGERCIPCRFQRRVVGCCRFDHE